MRLHIFYIVDVVSEQKPQPIHTSRVCGLSGFVKVVGDWFVPSVFDFRQVFVETVFKGATRSDDVEFGATAAEDDVHNAVCLVVELFSNDHL